MDAFSDRGARGDGERGRQRLGIVLIQRMLGAHEAKMIAPVAGMQLDCGVRKLFGLGCAAPRWIWVTSHAVQQQGVGVALSAAY